MRSWKVRSSVVEVWEDNYDGESEGCSVEVFSALHSLFLIGSAASRAGKADFLGLEVFSEDIEMDPRAEEAGMFEAQTYFEYADGISTSRSSCLQIKFVQRPVNLTRYIFSCLFEKTVKPINVPDPGNRNPGHASVRDKRSLLFFIQCTPATGFQNTESEPFRQEQRNGKHPNTSPSASSKPMHQRSSADHETRSSSSPPQS